MKFIRVGGLAIWNIGADNPHALNRGRDDALLLIFEQGIVLDHIGNRMARQNRHAVIGLLACIDHLIAGGIDVGYREFVVGQFGFLQTQHIYRIVGKPLQYLRQTDFEGIDVPGSDFHE